LSLGDRRQFLKACGLTVLTLARGDLVAALPAAVEPEPPGEKKPDSGVRWAMVVDPAKCRKVEGCTDCIGACHRIHNVPSVKDPRHDVKWIWKEEFRGAFPEQEAEYIDEELTKGSVLTFCNHCDNPPCVRVCPTQATWKRPDGIVAMDWHRCIGCRYCMAACPYGSRSFNWEDPRPYIKDPNPDYPTRTKGVVEKCTFCEERLAVGKPPACVEACKEKALIFGDLGDPSSEVRQVLRSRYALRRRPGLGTHPSVYYLV
jgi:Fe-S-cluster-containing dehydrogenase component